MVKVLSDQKSILGQYILELRDIEIQKDPLRFRANLERIGELMAFEISKTLNYESVITKTPLGESDSLILAQQPVLSTILRAGLPLHQGLLRVFDKAQNAFVSAYRKHHKDNSFEIAIEYLSSPTLQDKVLILSDPMLATGSSMVLAYQALITKGIPSHTHVVVVIASKQGVEYFKTHMPHQNYTLWIGAVDEELTAQSYIVPGLGDAGDLAYGEKS